MVPPGVLSREGAPVHVDAFGSIRIVLRLWIAFASGRTRACRCLSLDSNCPSVVACFRVRAGPCMSLPFARFELSLDCGLCALSIPGIPSRAGTPVHLDALCSICGRAFASGRALAPRCLCSIPRMWVVHSCSLLPCARWSFSRMRVMHPGAPRLAFASGRARACRCLLLDSICPSIVACFRERARPCMSMPFARFDLSLDCGLLSRAGAPVHVDAFCSI